MQYFGGFVGDKENRSSSLMVYFQNYWGSVSLKFCYLFENQNFGEVEEKDEKFRKIGRKY